MLTAARAALVELGALAPAEPLPPFWARMSGNLILMFYPLGNRSSYMVKIAVRARLDREFRGLTLAHGALPRHVPEPLRLATHGRFQVLVTRGIRTEQLAPRRGGVGQRILERGIVALLAASLRHFQASSTDVAVDVRDALREAGDAIEWSEWQAYWVRVGPSIAALPRILQHGDLAMTNVAAAGGELVFFDWEDFGLVDVVGFDFAIALLSLHDFDTRRLRESLAAPTAEARLLRRGCAQLELAPELFLELFPVYLSAFVKVKRSFGYDPAVAQRAVEALREWVRAGPPRLAAA